MVCLRFLCLGLVAGPAFCQASVVKSPPQDPSLEQLKKSVADNPFSSGNIYADLGFKLLEVGRFDEAIAAYSEAQKRGGSSPKFLAVCAYDIACCHARAGHKAQAWEKLREALRLGYRDLDSLRTDPDLDTLHGDPEWEEVAATRDIKKMSRDEAWRYTLWLLDREVRRIHYAPYTKRTAAQTDAEIKSMIDDVPRLDDDEIGVRIDKYMAGFGDGHTNARTAALSRTRIPLTLYWYEEGVCVQSAATEHKELVGQKLVAVEGKLVEQVVEMLKPCIARDNDMWIKLFAPLWMSLPHYMHGLGLTRDSEKTTMTFQDEAGKKTTVTLSGRELPRTRIGSPIAGFVDVRSMAGTAAPLSATHAGELHWFEYLPEEKLLYCQLNAVQNGNKETLAAFAKRLYAEFDAKGAEALVFDVRNNGGGNNTLLKPLILGAVQRPALNQRGHLYMVTGRLTFSACQNFLSRMENLLPITVAGEPSGSKPNFVGESVPIVLPYGGVSATVSDLYWEDGLSWDTRQWITPHIVAPPRLSDAKANRDGAMEAVLTHWRKVRTDG